MTPDTRPGHLVLIATLLVAAVLGSIHAFSVFLAPLETAFGQARATVSLTYSFALVSLTLAVTFGPTIYERLHPSGLLLAATGLAAAGALWAGQADTIQGVWLGYSLAFGAANGLGYGFGLQFAARALPRQPGWAMGVVTAAYAGGAAAAPWGFTRALEHGGFPAAMQVLAVALILVGAIAALLIWKSGLVYKTDAHASAPAPSRNVPIRGLWIAYGAGVAAGLMAIGHAAGLAEARGFSPWAAPTVLALCNLAGSLLSGALMDRVPPRRILTGLAGLTGIALAVLALVPQVTLAALGLVGFAYGGTIAANPAAIAARYPGGLGPRVYGKVFTAWGAAGLIAPWGAGRVYDATGGYGPALWLAAGLAVASAIMARRTFAKADPGSAAPTP